MLSDFDSSSGFAIEVAAFNNKLERFEKWRKMENFGRGRVELELRREDSDLEFGGFVMAGMKKVLPPFYFILFAFIFV